MNAATSCTLREAFQHRRRAPPFEQFEAVVDQPRDRVAAFAFPLGGGREDVVEADVTANGEALLECLRAGAVHGGGVVVGDLGAAAGVGGFAVFGVKRVIEVERV